MRLTKITIKNFRSICECGPISIEPLQALVGENNAGKSNILRALNCFLTSGAGGMQVGDFNDATQQAIIECEFSGLSDNERRKLRPYLIGDMVILRKELRLEQDEQRGKLSVKAEYHGYRAEPTSEHLSLSKIEANHGNKPKWKEIAEANGLLEYVQDAEGKVNKTSYKSGIERYLAENDVEYDDIELGETQALGLPQNLLSVLPEFYLLPAITDYSDEMDKRSNSTVFRRLMSDLSDRIMKLDPRYQELESALDQVRRLLNPAPDGNESTRLVALGGVEDSIRDAVRQMMPSVQSVSLGVEVDTSRDIFSRGVSIKIDDGVLTDVLDKGHGMQRSLVFSLLQMLIASSRAVGDPDCRPFILAIEEPELYIHPHSQRLVFQVLKGFATADGDAQNQGHNQVLYTTHSPSFVEIWNYERIGVVQKPSLEVGTIVKQAPADTLGDPEDKKIFKMLTCFSLKHNEIFFARDTIIAEGPEDEIGIIAAARKIGRVTELLDEIGVSVIVTNGKGDIPKFQKVLNAFGMPFGVLLEMDGKGDDDRDNAVILENLNGNRIAKVPNRVEDMLVVGRHFDDQRHAKSFFSDHANINADFEQIICDLLPPVS